ncbi:MAG: hypothetical protein Q9217_003779 [Psora testacea]
MDSLICVDSQEERKLILRVAQRSLYWFSQDLDKDDYIPEPYRQVSEMRAYELQEAEKEERKVTEKVNAKKLQTLGFEAEHAGEILF